MLEALCLCDLGRRKVQEINFMTDFTGIKHELSLTEEFRQILLMEPQFPMQDYWDATPALERIRIPGTWPEIQDVMLLRKSLEAIHKILAFFKKKESGSFPLLQQLASNVHSFPDIIRSIDVLLDPLGKIRDQASPQLAEIRRSMADKQSSVTRIMQRMLKQAQADGITETGTSLAIREGRTVIPVTASQKRKIAGIIHDESATGKTAYIEPAAVVETNNQIRELQFAEQREIIKILTLFADRIRPHLAEIKEAYNFLATIDFLRAKATLALRTGSIKPILSDTRHISWINARHPLMFLNLKKEGREIVPLNISFREDRRIVLISGPNAGGKSVCLKTVGLLQYMLQCGLLVPMSEKSEAGCFQNIFIDIGDEQSIENDLSTYSSHLKHMNFFSRHADPHTLILIDEFGTGTEPLLGGAIAEAILNYLNQKKAYGVITTHYGNLKHFASSSPGIINGAMLYDTGKMEPLFRLELGKPGSSFAFEIARKIGLNNDILDDATSKIGHEQVDFDKHLREVERDKRYWERKRTSIRQREKELEETLTRYKEQLEKSEQERKITLNAAKDEARKILEGANKQIEQTIRIIKESQAEKIQTREARLEMETFKRQIETSRQENENNILQKIEQLKAREEQLRNKRLEKEQNKITSTPTPVSIVKPMAKGDFVTLEGSEIPGEILTIEGRNATVVFGQMRTVVPVKRLKAISSNEAKRHLSAQRKPSQSFDTQERRINFKAGIDVRGDRTDDALIKVEEQVDTASMLGIGEIKILHGKGNGILRKMIRDYLSSSDSVASFNDESLELGGAGITVVKIK